MKFGYCIGTDVEKAVTLKKLGYDYAELDVTSFTNMNEAEFNDLLFGMKKSGLPCDAACCFLPSEIKVADPDTDTQKIKDYVKLAVKRSSLLGIKTIVFGSGGARKIPDNMTRDEGLKYIVAFLRDIVSPEIAKYNINIAIEPLGVIHCNAINTVEQGVALAEATGCDNIKALADVYHMAVNEENLMDIANKKGKILHSHTSYPWLVDNLRLYPRKNDKNFDQFNFINPVYLSGCPRLSVEVNIGDDFEAEASEALDVLKETYARVLTANKLFGI